MLMGRVVKDPEVKQLNDGKRVLNLKLAVNRSFPNSNGEYEVDFFNIVFWEFLVDYANDNLKKGSPVVVKGRMQNSKEELASGFNLNYPVLIGERIMLFNRNNKENE